VAVLWYKTLQNKSEYIYELYAWLIPEFINLVWCLLCC